MSALADSLYWCTHGCCFILSFGGVGISEVQRLNNIGESTPLCGTPVLIGVCFGFVLLYTVYCLHPRM